MQQHNNKENGEQRIIVIGASAGGLEALKSLVHNLPGDLDASIFIVWHMSPEVHGILPQVLKSLNSIEASHAINNEKILSNHIYIAPPDHHMHIDNGRILITHGPKENRFRPAVDPLFRSAAYNYSNRVIGIILSGALDDGTVGLWTVKHYGGIAIVQAPGDARVSSMPENALRKVQVDHVCTIAELPELLAYLVNECIIPNTIVMKDDQTKKEIEIAAEERGMNIGKLKFTELSPFTCPECHGVLSVLHNDNIVRYRCHTGHAYSADALLSSITEKIEDNLYSAIRGIEECIMLLNHIGDLSSEANDPKVAAVYFKKVKEADDRLQIVRKAAHSQEHLNHTSIIKQAEEKIG